MDSLYNHLPHTTRPALHPFISHLALFQLSGIVFVVCWLDFLIFQVLSHLSSWKSFSVSPWFLEPTLKSFAWHSSWPGPVHLTYGGPLPASHTMLEPSCANHSPAFMPLWMLYCVWNVLVSGSNSQAQSIAWYFQTDLCAFSICPLNFKTIFHCFRSYFFPPFLSPQKTVRSLKSRIKFHLSSLGAKFRILHLNGWMNE